MITPRIFQCNDVRIPTPQRTWENASVIPLNSMGRRENVNIRMEDVAKAFINQINPRLLDLLEIASFIYAADTSTSRGEGWIDSGTVESWGRKFLFIIPVRDIKFWKQHSVINLMKELILFLSNDECDFRFVPQVIHPAAQQYLDLGSNEDWPFYKPSRVVMFSGGLDSLAGTVESLSDGNNVVLVSHRPVATMDSRQKNLVKELQDRYFGKLIHIPVCINKAKKTR